jgi:hypothetical protein
VVAAATPLRVGSAWTPYVGLRGNKPAGDPPAFFPAGDPVSIG